MTEEQKRRERTIAFEMNYCQHYVRGKGSNMVCAAGMDIDKIKVVPTGANLIKWGPCIEGHTLKDPTSHCPKWIRHTREQGEARADSVERAMDIMTKVQPFISAWRNWSKQNPVAKAGVVECPACKGRLHLSQAAYNGHVRAKCETQNCVSFIE